MTRGRESLLDAIGDATSGAGSEALAALSNLGGGGAGGTVGRVVSAVAGRHGGFAPKVITSVTKHGIAGIERVEPLSGADRGYRAVAEDANGLESIRTIIELDPREYEVTVTHEEGAGVVEFVQMPEPEPEPTAFEPAVEPSPPVGRTESVDRSRGAREPRPSEPAVEPTPVRAGTRHDGEVQRAKAEAEKARAEAEAEKARVEAETARAEAEAAKARARAEQARAEAETEAIRNADTVGDGPPATPELDGSTVDSEQRAAGESTKCGTANGEGTGSAFSAPSPSNGAGPTSKGDPLESGARESSIRDDAATSGKWGLADDAGAESVSPGVQVESAVESGSTTAVETASKTAVDDEFESFVAADPVEDAAGEEPSGAQTSDQGIGCRGGDSGDGVPVETGAFEF